MKKIRFALIFTGVIFFLSYSKAQSLLPGKTLGVNYYDLSLPQCFHDISNKTGLTFAYRSNLLDSLPTVTLSFQHILLPKLLDTLLSHNHLSYVYKNRQIILVPAPAHKFLHFRGCILNTKDSVPVSYSSISIPKKSMGTISDYKGIYEWELSEKYKNDSVVVSSMGFEKKYMSIGELAGFNGKFIFLKENVISLPAIYINSRDYKTEEVGNKGNFTSGSIYLDTHGQQTGLFVENKHRSRGTLQAVSFYLCETGNTEAPLRIRIYSVDSLSEKPDQDLLPEIFIVQPDVDKGWYTVDLRSYRIDFPENGLFVALEGIFPNDYDYYSSSDDFIDISNKTANKPIETETPKSVSYGQQIGYNRREDKNTWHYSLSHTWFQLENQKFGVMIKASVQIEKHAHRRDKHFKKKDHEK